MNTLGEFYAIVESDGTLFCLEDGDPMIFARKGPYADSNAKKYNRRVVRVEIVEVESCDDKVSR